MKKLTEKNTLKRISIVLPSLGLGGAERLAVSLANEWIKKGYRRNMTLML